jgi:hypothetical protein
MFDASYVPSTQRSRSSRTRYRGESWSRPSPTTGRPVTVSAPTREAADSFDPAALLMAPLDRPQPVRAATKTVESPAMRRGRGRVAPNDRHKGGLHRYCRGCSRETEHVLRAGDDRGSIPSIRWSSAAPTGGTTICVNCGEWRTASFRPSAAAWSEWQRTRITTLLQAEAVASTDNPVDWVSETAAENEGMPPKPEPRLRPTSARVDGPRSRALLSNGAMPLHHGA